MINNTERLFDLCAGKSVAIVGNSENVTEYEVGEIIDSYDIVVRMNKFNTGPEYEKYTGTKTNIYVTCFWDKVLHPPSIVGETNIQHIISSIPCHPCAFFPDYQEYKRNMKKAYDIGWQRILQGTITYPSPEYYDQIGSFVGRRPSTGLIALCWFLDYVDFSDLYATGLSFGENKLHYNQENYKGVGPGKKHHNPYAERFAVYNVLNRCDKNVLFDPHMSKVLGNITDEDLHKHQRDLGEIARKEFS